MIYDVDPNIEWRQFVYAGIPTDYLISEYGNIYSVEKGKILKNQFSGAQRYWINQISVGGASINIPNHVLVALTYIGLPNKKEKTQVNHIDGNRFNNHYSNLEWVTPKENMIHALKTGLLSTVLNEDTVHVVCQLLCSGKYKPIEIAKLMGVSKATITDIKNKRTWKHITELYDINPPRKTLNLKAYSKEVNKMLSEGYIDDKIIEMYQNDIGKEKVQYLIRYNKKKLGIDYDPKGKIRGMKNVQRLSKDFGYIVYQRIK